MYSFVALALALASPALAAQDTYFCTSYYAKSASYQGAVYTPTTSNGSQSFDIGNGSGAWAPWTDPVQCIAPGAPVSFRPHNDNADAVLITMNSNKGPFSFAAGTSTTGLGGTGTFVQSPVNIKYKSVTASSTKNTTQVAATYGPARVLAAPLTVIIGATTGYCSQKHTFDVVVNFADGTVTRTTGVNTFYVDIDRPIKNATVVVEGKAGSPDVLTYDGSDASALFTVATASGSNAPSVSLGYSAVLTYCYN